MKICEFEKVVKSDIRVDFSKKNNLYSYMIQNDSQVGRTVIVNNKSMIMLGSYNYLGLIGHPKINQAMKNAIDEFGSGAGGVRLMTGNNILNQKLEDKITKFKGTEDTVVYSSGYVANIAAIKTLFGKNDLLIIDRFAHNSIYTGCKLSGASIERFNHNDLNDLKRILEWSSSAENRMIIVDAVYSMTGTITPLPEIIKLAKEYDVNVMVDEAHAIGVLGEAGRGIDEHFGIDINDVDIWMGTLSKTIPSIGGYITGNKKIIEYLKHSSAPFIFSAALPPPDLAASIAAFDIIEEEPERIQKLKHNISKYRKGLKNLGFVVSDDPTPIIPIVIGGNLEACVFAKKMQDMGIYVLPIIYPAVPKNGAILRTCIISDHTDEDIFYILDALEKNK